MWWRFRRRAEPVQERVEPAFKAGLNQPDFLGNLSDQGLTDFVRGFDAGTFGPPINETTAMRVSTVFACVKLGMDLVSSAPLGVYQDSPERGRVLATKHKLYRLLNVNPFPGRPMTSATWRQLWVAHVWLWGNHYSIIRYDNAMRVIGFEVAPPWQTTVSRQPDGTNVYAVRWSDSHTEYVPQDDMLHFFGPSFDGVAGLSRVAMFARDPIALAKVLEEQTGRVHENAARPSGMLTMPPGITPEGRRRMEAHWTARLVGRENAGKVVFADKDSTFTPFQMSPEDLNTLEARQYQAADICRFFGTPPHMVGLSAGTSAWGSGIEQLTLGYKQFTLHPQMVDFEQELTLKLFPTTEFFPSFDRAALVVMDALTQAQVAQTEIQSGVLTINERRRALQRPGVDGGDTPLVNSTMMSLERALNPPAPPPQQGSNNPPAPAEPAKKGPPNDP